MPIEIFMPNQEGNPLSYKTRILEKLQNIVNNPTFFYWDGDDLACSNFANVRVHNRAALLLALFTDSLNEDYKTYTEFHDKIKFCQYKNTNLLRKLEEFVNSIQYLNEIQIKVTREQF